MKRFLLFFVAVAFVLTLSACSEKELVCSYANGDEEVFIYDDEGMIGYEYNGEELDDEDLIDAMTLGFEILYGGDDFEETMENMKDNAFNDFGATCK